MSSPLPDQSQVTIASQSQNAAYCGMAIAMAWFWDLLDGIPEEAQLFVGRRLAFPDFIYLLSRVITFPFMVLLIVFCVIPVEFINCHALELSLTWLAALATPCNTLLFFFRVRAIFKESPKAVWVFGFLWLSTCASILFPISLQDAQDVGTYRRVCLGNHAQGYGAAGFLTVLVYDTSVFLAISWKVLSVNLASGWKEKLKVFINAATFGYVSKLLLRTGQLYYLCTIWIHFFTVIALVLPSLSPIYRAVIALASVALHNLMACRVFRLLKLGFMESPESIKSESHTCIRFASRNSNSASRYSEDNITSHGHELQSGNGTRSRFQSTLSASDGPIPPSSPGLRDGDHM